eukprot:5007497-Amphidinium_carterae.1
MSPNSRGDPQNKEARSLTPRTRRFVHKCKRDEDEDVISLERHTEHDEQKQKTQGYERTTAQRLKLCMTVDGNEAVCRQLDMKTLELEKSQFELHT